MPDRQYIRAQFKPREGRAYTYHHDGEPLAVGDRVHVESRHGIATVHVCEVDVEEPAEFETKPIIGRVEPDEIEPDEEAA